MTPEVAAWSLKNNAQDGDQQACIDVLRTIAPFTRVVYAPPVDGHWEMISVEPAEPPTTRTLYRRAAPEHQHGLFWARTALEAWMHTANRFGLVTYQREFEPAELVAEFVMRDRHGRESGGEFIAIGH